MNPVMAYRLEPTAAVAALRRALARDGSVRHPGVQVGVNITSGLDARSSADGDLNALLSGAADPYATLRSAYLQYQEGLLHDGAAPIQNLPDIDAPPPAPPPEAPPPTPGPAASSDEDAPLASAGADAAPSRGTGPVLEASL